MGREASMNRTLLACLLLLLAGCSRITQSNYEKLRVGMTYDEVIAILGKPTSCSDVMIARSCIWGDEKRNISVTFVGNQILLHTSLNLK